MTLQIAEIVTLRASAIDVSKVAFIGFQWNNFLAMRSISLSIWSWGSSQMNFC